MLVGVVNPDASQAPYPGLIELFPGGMARDNVRQFLERRILHVQPSSYFIKNYFLYYQAMIAEDRVFTISP
ncbi:hypothetical protein KL86DES1_10870 [uncultured Desulfovibrio sp.]|uniref:Uncharacterized protein n=1 Tax=uncultured Desulfovibrio sp. TaxID=167968 RepID=A0A212L161_9BACT|nr:hypothetical protein KL86DES1_10870 [uncultured Desulfovibrio sp.]VZH32743.1 conserved protein of unknown function [Desulfovibrio sp. 86]